MAPFKRRAGVNDIDGRALPLVVALTLIVLLAASRSAETASATRTESGAVPQGLVGRWIRNVTTADLLRLPNSYASPGVYLFRIK